MNKNQKKTPYTYSKLIRGNRFSAAYHSVMMDRISGSIRKAKAQGKETSELVEKLRYHRGQLDYFNEEFGRLSLTRAVCGDETVLIR